VDSTTKPKVVAYRDILIGILTGLDEQDEPAVQEALHGFLDDLHEAPAFDVALGAFEVINRLTAELSVWTGKPRAESLRELAAAIAPNPAP
jgi:hypothetical protein